MPALTIDAGAPAWAQRFAGAASSALAALRAELRSQPLRPAQYQFDNLPDAARWPGAIIAVWDGAAYSLRLSDGVAWRKLVMEP